MQEKRRRKRDEQEEEEEEEGETGDGVALFEMTSVTSSLGHTCARKAWIILLFSGLD